jgi:hypothetical protein
MDKSPGTEQDPDIQSRTTECVHNFSCLDGKRDCLCEVETAIDNKVIFVKPQMHTACNYKLSFGYKFICNCPTRNHLYLSHKV